MSSMMFEFNQRLHTVANLRKMNKQTKVENRIANLGFTGALVIGKKNNSSCMVIISFLLGYLSRCDVQYKMSKDEESSQMLISTESNSTDSLN